MWGRQAEVISLDIHGPSAGDKPPFLRYHILPILYICGPERGVEYLSVSVVFQISG